MKKEKLIFLLLVFLIQSVKAETINFEDLWRNFEANSLNQQSLRYEKDMFKQSLDRSKKHWLPRAYLGARLSVTDNPTEVFFNNLGQRSIEAADFNPSDLNNPNYKTFKNSTLGLDMPLYEGSLKVEQKNMHNKLFEASKLKLKANNNLEYASLLQKYVEIALSKKYADELLSLKIKLGKIIANYNVGEKSNPVGYSGLLGLKGLLNKIDAFVLNANLRAKTNEDWISSKVTIKNWSVVELNNLEGFISSKLKNKETVKWSSGLKAHDLEAQSLDSVKNMQNARYLPKIGLFAQADTFDGDRDFEISKSIGLYLNWDLFNSDSLGRTSEAAAKALAAKSKISAFKLEEKNARESLLNSKQVLLQSLRLLDSSKKILSEQNLNAMKLFNSGMISAIELSQITNSQIDLLKDKNEAELQYLNINKQLYIINN